MKIKKHKNGYWYAYLWAKSPVSLKTKDEREAQARAREANLEDLERLSQMKVITTEAISRVTMQRRMSFRAAATAWAEWMGESNLSPMTKHRYLEEVNRFLSFHNCESQPVSTFTHRLINAWVNAPGPQTVGTRNARMAAISKFETFLAGNGWIIGRPTLLVDIKYEGLTFEQKEPAKKELFTEEELAALYTGVEDPFWYAAIRLANECGLRLSDCACVEAGQFRDGKIIVWMEKTNSRVELPCPYRFESRVKSGPLFPEAHALFHDVRNRCRLSLSFAKILKDHSIIGKSFHCFRHTFATRHRSLGMTIDEIRVKLGHSSTDTTKIYTDHEYKNHKDRQEC